MKQPAHVKNLLPSLIAVVMVLLFQNCTPSFSALQEGNNQQASLSVPGASVTYYSIKWEFSEVRPTGHFINGEPWVVGPVTITGITPNNSGMDNSALAASPPCSGSMRLTVPNTFHGYCPKLAYYPGLPHVGVYYDKALDVSRNLPTTLVAGEMLMTSRGQAETSEIRSSINEIAVLTVLDAVPPEGSFRPALFSTTPRTVQFNKNQIHYDILKNLPPVPATPSQASIEAFLPALPWFEFDNSWVQSGYGASNNFATNGQQFCSPWRGLLF